MTKRKTFILVFIMLVLLCVGGYGLKLYLSIHAAMEEIHKPLVKSEKIVAPMKEQADKEQQAPFSVLLLGVDERPGDVGRSDTMIVITANPQKQSLKMLSIPRDTRVPIIGNNTVEKINHAYARGGVPMSIATVEHLLNIPIDYYVKVNMEGFLQIIDVLDGITVQNDVALSVNKHVFPAGELSLTAEEALVFSRIRYEDPRGDFGRQVRQRQIIEGILNKAYSVSMIWKMDEMMNEIKDEIETNFTFTEILQMQSQYEELIQHIEQLKFEKGKNQYIHRYWYYLPDQQELDTISKQLQTHLRGK